MSLRGFGVYEIFCRNARAFGKNTAIVSGDEQINFSQLKNQADALAAGLAAQGVLKGDRIAVLALNTHKFFWVFGAAAAIGAIVVPINWRLSENELGHILADVSPKKLIVDSEFAELAKKLLQNNAPVKSLLCFDANVDGLLCIDEIMKSSKQMENKGLGADPFCIIHTAAVEGKPRGAVLSHDNIIFGNIQTMATLHLGVQDSYLNMLPMFHITGLNLSMSVMHAGGKNAVMKKFDPALALDLCKKERITVLGSFPPILSKLEQELALKTRNLSSLKHIYGIDAPDAIASWEEKTNSDFWVLYGQTETSGVVSISKSKERPGSSGRQALLADLRFVDDDGKSVPLGEKGEILVRGPLVFSGYWDKGKISKQSISNGWHHTGDLGKMDEQGFLWFAGRKPEKELIKPGGENVYPAEVENIIITHPDILEVCVIGVPDPKFGEGIKAVCVTKAQASPTTKELIEFVAARIARYKKPRYVAFVDSLPKNKDGSISRDQVKKLHGKEK